MKMKVYYRSDQSHLAALLSFDQGSTLTSQGYSPSSVVKYQNRLEPYNSIYILFSIDGYAIDCYDFVSIESSEPHQIGPILNHLGSILYHSEPSDVPYSLNQSLGWDFICRFLQQDSSKIRLF